MLAKSRSQKVALVVGAGGGIGSAAATDLAQDGFSLVCLDRKPEDLEPCVRQILAQGSDARALVLDITAPDAADDAMATTLSIFGQLDVLVFAAGVTSTASVLELSYSDWENVLSVNLTAAFRFGQSAAKVMVAHSIRGSIIFISSQLSWRSIPNKVAYLASKGGLTSLMKGMALDLAEYGIRVNAVAPGPVLTGLTEARFADRDVLDWTIARLPSGRLGRPEEISAAIRFLASDNASWIYGTSICVDGGYLLT